MIKKSNTYLYVIGLMVGAGVSFIGFETRIEIAYFGIGMLGVMLLWVVRNYNQERKEKKWNYR